VLYYTTFYTGCNIGRGRGSRRFGGEKLGNLGVGGGVSPCTLPLDRTPWSNDTCFRSKNIVFALDVSR